MAKTKRANNDLQSAIQLKTEPHKKPGVKLAAPERYVVPSPRLTHISLLSTSTSIRLLSKQTSH